MGCKIIIFLRVFGTYHRMVQLNASLSISLVFAAQMSLSLLKHPFGSNCLQNIRRKLREIFVPLKAGLEILFPA